MLVYDLADVEELTGFVRALDQEEFRNRFTLQRILPTITTEDIEYVWRAVDSEDFDAAKFRAWDTESAIAKRKGAVRKRGELPPVSRKSRLGEEERLRLRALERGNNDEIEDAIFDDASNLGRSVAARLEMARGEILYSGSLTLNENGIVATVDFNRDASHEVAPATLWSDHATSTPLQDLLGWMDVYVDTNGAEPGEVLTSRKVLSDMLLNEEFRQLASATGVTPSRLSQAELNTILDSHGIPPVVTYNTRVRVDGVQQRVIPEDRLILLPPPGEPLGNTVMGVTAEATVLVGAQQLGREDAPGLVAVVDVTSGPVSTWTEVVGIGLPILANPDLTLVADVR